MYRSIFDRKQAPNPLDDNKGVSQRPKKAGNVFYVVLRFVSEPTAAVEMEGTDARYRYRHGHLMLFDDDEQLEVRHVISLAHHHVSIYSGGDRTPYFRVAPFGATPEIWHLFQASAPLIAARLDATLTR